MRFLASLRALFLILYNTSFSASLSKILPSVNFRDELFFSQVLQLPAVNEEHSILIFSFHPDSPLLRDFFIHRHKLHSIPCVADPHPVKLKTRLNSEAGQSEIWSFQVNPS